MEYNPNNPELLEKIQAWGESPELAQEEMDTFLNEKMDSAEGLEWYEFVYSTFMAQPAPASILGSYSTLLRLAENEKSLMFFFTKYYELFNEMSDTAFEPLTIATICKDIVENKMSREKDEKIFKELQNEHYFWSSICASLYKEMNMPEKSFELISPYLEKMDQMQKTSTYLYSDIPSLIEIGKEMAADIDCDEMYARLDPKVVTAGSIKFYSGFNKDGLIHHFGAEDFRPKEFVGIPKIPNHKTADFNGKSVVVTTYRGMGDSMILSRFIPRFKAKYPGVKLSIATEKHMIPLYKNMKEVHHVGDVESCVGMIFDYCLGVNHLARYLREELVDENGATPAYDWVAYPETYDRKWENKIPENAIGINWKSSQRLGGTGGGIRSQERYKGRDIPYKEFSVILDAFPNQTFVVLNPDLDEEERADLEFRSNVIIPKLRDFGDTAAIINRCSVVVSVDTSISTLSASMHKNTIVMAKFWCDYRWMYPHLWWKTGVAKVFKKELHSDSWVRPLFSTIEELKKKYIKE